MKRKALFIGYVGLVVVAAVYCTLFLLMLEEWLVATCMFAIGVLAWTGLREALKAEPYKPKDIPVVKYLQYGDERLELLDCEWCDEEFCAEFSEDHGGTMCTKCYKLWVGVAHQVYSKS